MVSHWDAPSAIKAAIRAAGPGRHIFVADLALRLARLAHVTEVRFNIAPGTSLEAIRLALAEVTAEAASWALAELAPPEPPGDAPAETMLAGAVAAQREEPAADAPETLPDAKATFPKDGSSSAHDAILAVLASGPSSSRDLATQLHWRSGTILAALHGLEQAGRVVRSQRTGRGARWVLGPHGRP
jgi:hypothetical protein